MKKYLILFLITCATYCFGQLTEYQPISFQSTSTMQSIGSQYSSAPMISENGTATYNGAIHHQNKVGPLRNGSGTPSTPGQGNESDQVPIGDVPFIFMILVSLLYVITVKWKNEKSST